MASFSSAAAAMVLGTRSIAPIAAEITLQASDGIRMAAQHWKHADNKETHRRILALHGWMDNAASYHHLAPRILDNFPEDTEIVALDLVGHGKSSHKSIDGQQCMLAEGAYYVAEAIDQLDWKSFTLIGHSMGAAISCLYSAAFPEQVERLVLVEGIGPMARNPRDVAKHVRAHIQRRMLGQKQMKQPRIYESFQDAVNARCQTAKNFPGNQYLSEEAAAEMVRRGSRTLEEGKVQFRHDPRLTYPSLQYFTIEQTEALYQDITCPTALILAEDGWPWDEEKFERMLDLLKPSVFKKLPGSHHFHADPLTADAVADEVIRFLRQK